MKITTLLVAVLTGTLALANISCKNKQAKNQQQQYDPYGGAYGTDPYGQQQGQQQQQQQQQYPGYNQQGDYVNVTPVNNGGYNAYQQQPAYTEPSYSYQDTPAAAPAASGGSTYTVRSGDNLYRIGLNHGVSVGQLKSANGISGDLIQPGDVLTIP